MVKTLSLEYMNVQIVKVAVFWDKMKANATSLKTQIANKKRNIKRMKIGKCKFGAAYRGQNLVGCINKSEKKN